MNMDIVRLWDKNKNKLQSLIEQTPQSEFSYNFFIRNIVKIILGMENASISEIDHGEYQGTKIYVIVNNEIYQPYLSDYYITYVYYGSCPEDDYLESIRRYSDGFPDEAQTIRYMDLCLHLIQRMRCLMDVFPDINEVCF